MQKLKLSITLMFLSLSAVIAQEFAEPFTTFISDRECYVITADGEEVFGTLRAATESRGFITRLRIRDESGQIHKFKAEDVVRFAIRPDAFTKSITVSEKATSIRHIITTDHNNILDRDWIYYDAQSMPRRKNKIALLQLLNPGFDEFIKVYDHRNGSKSMPISIGGVHVVGGEERTLLVVQGDSKPRIVRKASFKKAFVDIFSDQPEIFKTVKGKPKFKEFARYIQTYNVMKDESLAAQR
ncbi:hypothetical protein [Roseivirga misakiensis]|uniref:Uncharacterized protein n=1 Tax=Roseivirga misakiensis TaxID=1563681 RepID=A0A1E5T173_9BACT|nr:hypothetical protein [Roseivirga misakiensis]OEK05128.1 hypothetical protein BFP71_17070 [Roseivirga misakiensis]